MSLSTPRIVQGVLSISGGTYPTRLRVGDPEWYAWLDTATMFAFSSEEGIYTARKELAKRGDPYWKAYRRRNGTLFTAYIGKTETLSYEQLLTVARSLQQKSSPNEQIVHTHARLVEHGWFTKFTVPLPRPTDLPRPHLLQHLQNSINTQGTFLIAPAGYGKTTLLGEWTQHISARRIAWVSLEEADNDPLRFWRVVLAALEQAGTGNYRDLRHSLSETQEPEALVAYINRGLHVPTLLILDDYQLMTQARIHEQMEYFLTHHIATLHVAIASRTTPPFALERLHLQGHVTVLQAPTLCLTPDEVAAMIHRQAVIPVAAADIERIVDLCEGWVAGVQLLLLTLQQTPSHALVLQHLPPTEITRLFTYLVDEILHKQPAVIQTFLLKTALLSQMNAELCQVVTGETDTVTILAALERDHLFLQRITPQSSWYRYHPLFTAILQAHSQILPPAVSQGVLQAAANWHMMQDNLEDALTYALRGQDDALAAKVLVQLSDRLDQRGEGAALQYWFDQFPEQVILQHPLLALVYADLALTQGNLPVAQRFLQATESELASQLEETPLSYKRSAVLGQLAYLQGNFSVAIAHFRQAITQVPYDAVYQRVTLMANLGTAFHDVGEHGAHKYAYETALALSKKRGDSYLTMAMHCMMAQRDVSQGRLRQGFAQYRQAIWAHDQPLPRTTMVYMGMGEILYEWNALTKATQYIEAARQLSTQWGNVQYALSTEITWARLQRALGNGDEANQVLMRAEERSHRLQFGLPYVSMVDNALVEGWLACGDIELARQKVQSYDLDLTIPVPQRSVRLYVMTAALLIADQQAITAIPVLEQVIAIGNSDKYVSILTQIKARLLYARALHQVKRNELIVPVITQALLLAEPGQYVRVFLDNAGATLSLLLRQWLHVQPKQDMSSEPQRLRRFAQKILRALHQAHDDRSSENSFSQREREILALLAAGRTTREIAQIHMLAESTVKWYLHKLYEKLGVHTQLQAVARARDLGVL